VAVIVDAARIWIRAIRRPDQVRVTETPAEPSRIFAPAGLIPTAEEREQMAMSGRAET
jgi:carbon starvation protein